MKTSDGYVNDLFTDGWSTFPLNQWVQLQGGPRIRIEVGPLQVDGETKNETVPRVRTA